MRCALKPALLAFTLVGVGGAAYAGPGLPGPEPSLLGVRLMSPYRSVMARFGQPTRIQPGSPAPGGAPAAAAPTPAAPAPATPTGGGTTGTARRGFPRPAGGAGAGPSGGGGGGAAPAGSTRSIGAGGGGEDFVGVSSGGATGGARPGGGLPGFGGPGTSGAPGIGSPLPTGGSQAISGSGGDAGEVTWWYENQRKGTYFAFLFNHEGRVIQIQEYGWVNYKGAAGRTRRGIGLGSNLKSLVHSYGWSNDGEQAGDTLLFRYGNSPQLAFQLVNNKVVGITLAVGG